MVNRQLFEGELFLGCISYVWNQFCFNSRSAKKAFKPCVSRNASLPAWCLAGVANGTSDPQPLFSHPPCRLLEALFRGTASQNSRRIRKGRISAPNEILGSPHKVNSDKQMKCLKTVTAFMSQEFCEQFHTDLWHYFTLAGGEIFLNPFPWFICSREHKTSDCIKTNIGIYRLCEFLIS